MIFYFLKVSILKKNWKDIWNSLSFNFQVLTSNTNGILALDMESFNNALPAKMIMTNQW